MTTELRPKWPKKPSRLRMREHAFRAFARTLRSAAESSIVMRYADSADRAAGNIVLRVEIREDELDGGFVGRCLDLPGCGSQGETRQEATENLVEAIVGVLEVRMQRALREEDGQRPDTNERTQRLDLRIPVPQ